MSRVVSQTLLDAISNQQGETILRVKTWANLAAYNAAPTVPERTWQTNKFKIEATEAEAHLITDNDYTLSDFTVFIIERGVTLSATEYVVQSGIYFVTDFVETDGRLKIKGSSFPDQKIIIDGDDTYENVITAFCTEIGKTAVFKDTGAAWLDYRFLPTGKQVILNKAERFENLIRQKYLIQCYERSPKELVFYHATTQQSAWKDIVFADSQLILAATSGSHEIARSTNGLAYTKIDAPQFTNAVAYSPTLDLFAAVGNGVCITSPDGVTWTNRTIGAGEYNSVTWSDDLGIFTAIGIGIFSISSNGTTWTHTYSLKDSIDFASGTAIPIEISGHQAIYLDDNRILLIAGYDATNPVSNKTYFGTISGNTITWESGTNLPARRYNHTATLLADGRVLVIGGEDADDRYTNTYFGTISGNTITWANGTDLPAARSFHTTTLLSDGRILVIGGYTTSVQASTIFGTISSNTITWASGTDLPAARLDLETILLPDNRILVSGGGYVNTYFGTISGNTITWANGTDLPAALSGNTVTLLSETNPRILVTGSAAAADNTYFGTISGNTITWANGTDLPAGTRYHTATLLSDERILITGGDNGSSLYDDTRFLSIQTNDYNSIASLGTLLVGVGVDLCVTSTDGSTWTSRTIPAGTYHKIIYANGLFVAVGASKCATSPDGITWTERTIPAGTYTGLAYSSSLDLFVAIGDNLLATSPDGITWTSRTAPADQAWQSVAWSDTLAQFFAVSSDGDNRIASSTDGINWQILTTQADYSFSYLDGPASSIQHGTNQVHFISRDETASVNTSGDTSYPAWNLGYLKSTDSAPGTLSDPFYKFFLQKAPLRLDLTDGDRAHFEPSWALDPTQAIDAMITIVEVFDSLKSPAWYQEIRSLALFDSVEGGSLPSTIERVAAFTPLVSSGFDGNLTPSVNNLQALAEAVDDLNIASGPATTAVNDFQVGDGLGAWVKKTLAQTITILGIFADAASDSIYYVRRNAGWTNLKTYTDTLYALLVHTHAAGDITDLPVKVLYNNTLTGSAASFDITSIPSGYAFLELIYTLRLDSTGTNAIFIINNDTSALYNQLKFVIMSGGALILDSLLVTQFSLAIGSSGDTANYPGSGKITMPGYDSSVFVKTMQAVTSRAFNDTAGSQRLYNYHLMYKSTTPISRITISAQTGNNFIAGSQVVLVGYK